MKKVLFVVWCLVIVFATTRSYAQWTVDGNNIYNSNSGNVGIGNNNPGSKLVVGPPSDGRHLVVNGGPAGIGKWGLATKDQDLLFQNMYPSGLLWLTRVTISDFGSIGINTTPASGTKLHINDGAVIATGGSTSFPSAIAGAGTRMMWLPSDKAFRAGWVSGTHWDASNIGDASAAFGYNVTASGSYSFATGFETSATGGWSFAQGSTSEATGQRSTVINGFNSKAEGLSSLTMGPFLEAIQSSSMAIGAGGGYGPNKLVNNISNSLMIGFNSNLPTVFVGPANGLDTFGQVGIGTTVFQSDSVKLAVNGKVTARELELTVVGWPDYVFDPARELRTLAETEEFILKHRHLPGVPSAQQVEANGLNVGEMDRIMMEKIEELTLYMIALKKENDQLKKAVKNLKNK
jgi:hypothetical protein